MTSTQATRDLHERALAALDAGRTVGEVAAVIGMDSSTIRRWRRTRADRLHRTAPHRGRGPLLGAADLAELRDDVASHPEDTRQPRHARWALRTGVLLSLSTVSRRLRDLAITVKKRR